MNVGVLGGTFDPPHVGHLIAAQDAALALGLERVLLIPAATPPHKQNLELTEPPLRALMLALAIQGDSRFAMDTLELERAGPSYTVDTLVELAGRDPAARWTLLMGADQYAQFEQWRDPARIRSLANVAVLTRSGQFAAPGTSAAGPAARDAVQHRDPAVRELIHGDVAVEVTRIDISSTTVRQRVAAGVPIRYLVPRTVEQFIFDHGLYVGNGTPATGYHVEYPG